MESERVTLRLPKNYLQQMDIFIETGMYMSRSEIIRHALTDYFAKNADNMIEQANKFQEIRNIGQSIAAEKDQLKPYLEK